MQKHQLQDQIKLKKCQEKFFCTLLFRIVILVPILVLEILLPLFIDGIFGHIWGSLAAVINVIGWIYYGTKLKIALSTRVIIWLLPFILVVSIAIVELAHLFHWQITSNGNF